MTFKLRFGLVYHRRGRMQRTANGAAAFTKGMIITSSAVHGKKRFILFSDCKTLSWIRLDHAIGSNMFTRAGGNTAVVALDTGTAVEVTIPPLGEEGNTMFYLALYCYYGVLYGLSLRHLLNLLRFSANIYLKSSGTAGHL